MIKTYIMALVLVFAAFFTTNTALVAADDCPPNDADPVTGLCNNDDPDEIKTVIKNALSTVFFWTSIIATIFVIIGGINYSMSQGDPGKVKKAKDTILYAIIGLVISLSAFAIVQFVIDAAGGNV